MQLKWRGLIGQRLSGMESLTPGTVPSHRWNISTDSLILKMLSDFCRNLAIRHFVDCFDADDAPAETFFGETFFELALRLTGAEYKNRLDIADMRDHFVKVFVQMAGKFFISLVVRPPLLRSAASGKSDVLLHARFD
ncbi:MAG TPA: hypothetical protein VL754_07510 [Verrucomicrobiae bacterium]|nr:hypothetical protein [Verrucomicrobiae bacterium]